MGTFQSARVVHFIGALGYISIGLLCAFQLRPLKKCQLACFVYFIGPLWAHVSWLALCISLGVFGCSSIGVLCVFHWGFWVYSKWLALYMSLGLSGAFQVACLVYFTEALGC